MGRLSLLYGPLRPTAPPLAPRERGSLWKGCRGGPGMRLCLPSQCSHSRGDCTWEKSARKWAGKDCSGVTTPTGTQHTAAQRSQRALDSLGSWLLSPLRKGKQAGITRAQGCSFPPPSLAPQARCVLWVTGRAGHCLPVLCVAVQFSCLGSSRPDPGRAKGPLHKSAPAAPLLIPHPAACGIPPGDRR